MIKTLSVKCEKGLMRLILAMIVYDCVVQLKYSRYGSRTKESTMI